MKDLKSRTDQELIEARSRLTREYQKHTAEASKIANILSNIKYELRVRRNTDGRPFVSDHAVLRYLERVQLLDIEGIRDNIASKAPKSKKQLSDIEGFNVDGFEYKLSTDKRCITTIIDPKTSKNEE